MVSVSLRCSVDASLPHVVMGFGSRRTAHCGAETSLEIVLYRTGTVSYVNVGRAIPRSKRLCTPTTLVKTVFELLSFVCHVQGNPKCNNIEANDYCIVTILYIGGLLILVKITFNMRYKKIRGMGTFLRFLLFEKALKVEQLRKASGELPLIQTHCRGQHLTP